MAPLNRARGPSDAATRFVSGSNAPDVVRLRDAESLIDEARRSPRIEGPPMAKSRVPDHATTASYRVASLPARPGDELLVTVFLQPCRNARLSRPRPGMAWSSRACRFRPVAQMKSSPRARRGDVSHPACATSIHRVQRLDLSDRSMSMLERAWVTRS